MENQLENNEQRRRLSTKGTLQAVMPGGVTIENGVHIVGHIPAGSLIDGFQAWINGHEEFGGDVTLSLGTPDIPGLFFNGVTVLDGGTGLSNDPAVPINLLVSNEPLVATVTFAGTAPAGILNMLVSYTEIDTKVGKYTA